MKRANFYAWQEAEMEIIKAARARGHKQVDVLNALFGVTFFDYLGLNKVRRQFGLEPLLLDDEEKEEKHD